MDKNELMKIVADYAKNLFIKTYETEGPDKARKVMYSLERRSSQHIEAILSEIEDTELRRIVKEFPYRYSWIIRKMEEDDPNYEMVYFLDENKNKEYRIFAKKVLYFILLALESVVFLPRLPEDTENYCEEVLKNFPPERYWNTF